jgi:hypothetical protein
MVFCTTAVGASEMARQHSGTVILLCTAMPHRRIANVFCGMIRKRRMRRLTPDMKTHWIVPRNKFARHIGR